MEEINLEYTSLLSLGYVTCNVPEEVFSVIKTEIDDLIENNFQDGKPYNKYLAGIIEKEFALEKSKNILNDFFKVIIPGYWESVGCPQYANDVYQLTKQPWVNLQKKHEINPMHTHDGVLSYVLYVKIPYLLEEERKLPRYSTSNDKFPWPTFRFAYPRTIVNDYRKVDYRGMDKPFFEEYCLSVDQRWEGKMIIFPSYLPHSVMPFYTSEGYRISVSGNLAPINNG